MANWRKNGALIFKAIFLQQFVVFLLQTIVSNLIHVFPKFAHHSVCPAAFRYSSSCRNKLVPSAFQPNWASFSWIAKQQ
ncbi:MAG: hypothetical protein IPM82_13940 [Saprospiraceae bacterium]|nr:hypothetical protein [Saprospiraceae bacterium]